MTRATLEEVVPAPLRTRMSRQELLDVSPHIHLRLLADLFRRDDFDVIHSHLDIWTLSFAATSETPAVTTLHGRLDLPQVRKVLPLYPQAPLVSISDDQRRAVGDLDLNWMATVPHGLELGSYLQHPRQHNEHLAFVGRVCPEKGLDTAISVARRCGRPLQIAAKVDPMDVDYFECSIEPLLGEDTTFVGEIGEDRKPSFFASAAATLFPINWPEPFGLVMVESLAAGTPVIALRRGSVPEIVPTGSPGSFATASTNSSRPSAGSTRSIPRTAAVTPARSQPTSCALGTRRSTSSSWAQPHVWSPPASGNPRPRSPGRSLKRWNFVTS